MKKYFEYPLDSLPVSCGPLPAAGTDVLCSRSLSLRLTCRLLVRTLAFLLVIQGIPAGKCLAQGQPLKISATGAPGSFPLVSGLKTAGLVCDDRKSESAMLALRALRKDIGLLSGRLPSIADSVLTGHSQLIAGTLGDSRTIDMLARKKLIPAALVTGKWETFGLSVITDPSDRGKCLLIIFGSDPRGTAFGILELSRMLGVSPWVWWADVKPKPMKNIFVRSGKMIIGPPSVKYRGFFLNDEDWGLRPWAADNMDRDIRDIGPRTYERVFELMLRLKANYLWPAMHPGTKAFWYYAENPILARRYGILMGSSHHEPMLRDTEFEWNENFKQEYGKDHGEWRYDTNKDEIYRFFDDRVKQSVGNPAIYTIGMRATKDGGMSGPGSVAGKIEILESVMRDQRDILTKRLKKPADQIPQVFCPYKEVLELYRAGLRVPQDVTITWVDDNHGYIRQLPNPVERLRSGGSGIYYHFSYWGLPQDYLWLSSTSPVLTSFEMSKAFALNARRIWVFNVGDIKPAELELEFAMDLAWNVSRWPPEKAHQYVYYWAGKTFGPQLATEIGNIKSLYYKLAAAGKPEHLNGTQFSSGEIDQRLLDYDRLVRTVERTEKAVPARLKDAFFELVAYPAKAAAAMNRKIFFARKSEEAASAGGRMAGTYAHWAMSAYREISELGMHYNHRIAGGKWNRMMDDHPRGRDIFGPPLPHVSSAVAEKGDSTSLHGQYINKTDAVSYFLKGNDNGHLRRITGLGSSGAGLTVWPLSSHSYGKANMSHAPFAEYRLRAAKGQNVLNIKCLPTFPLYIGMQLRYAVSVNGSAPEPVNIASEAESSVWSANVLRGYSMGSTPFVSQTAAMVRIRIYFPDPGLVLSQLTVTAEGAPKRLPGVATTLK